MRFTGPAACVASLDPSRAFYEGLLGLTVPRVMSRREIPVAVAYPEGLSTWLASDGYASPFGDPSLASQDSRGGNWANTSETDGYEAISCQWWATGAQFLHEPRTLPWGQCGFRVYDPDGHILDLAETMSACV